MPLDDSKIIIIGANGQLGKALSQKYPNAQKVDSEGLDITNEDAVNSFSWGNEQIILNAAAYTKVDEAETTEGRKAAWQVNSVAVSYLADVANEHNSTLLHISTDYVFDGTTEAHTEEEPFSPLSVYGSSKAAGDIAASLAKKHYILRTSWVIGDGANFVRTMLSLAQKNISPTVVSDQVGRLTFTNELVRAIDHLLTNGAAYGVYNVTNSGEPASWADITREIFSLAGYDSLTVTNTSTSEYFANKPEAAPRPLHSTLNLDKLTATGFASSDWKYDLASYIENALKSNAEA